MARPHFSNACTRQGRRAWALWLALLWPLAGTAALLHSYGHLPAALAQGEPPAALTQAGGEPINLHALQGCDLCLVAAAGLLGAPAAAPDTAPVLRLPQVQQAVPAAAPLQPPAGLHFSARAPPFA